MPANDCEVAAPRLALNVRFRDRPIGDLAAEMGRVRPKVVCPQTGRLLDLCVLGEGEHVFNVDAKVAHRAFDLGMN
jgi:hypothetical protein